MAENNLSASEFEASLDRFTGTTAWHRWSGLFRNFVLTDGARFVAEQGGAYWLMDAIASHFGKLIRKYGLDAIAFQEWKLRVGDNHLAILRCEDGNGRELTRQTIPYTDFPLGKIKLWVEYSEDNTWVILLPSEH